MLTLDCTLSFLFFCFIPSLPCIRRAREWDRERERKFIYILFLPSLDGTTSGFFSSYISSDWLKGTEIFSLIGKLPGRCLLFDFLLFAVRTFSTTTMPIITQTRAVRRPTRIPNESIVDRSKVSDGSVVDGCTAKSVHGNEKKGEEKNVKQKQNNLCNTRQQTAPAKAWKNIKHNFQFAVDCGPLRCQLSCPKGDVIKKTHFPKWKKPENGDR